MHLEVVKVPGHGFALRLAPGVLDAKAAVGGDGFEFGFDCGDALDQGSELPGRAGEGALLVLCQQSGSQQDEQREDRNGTGNAFHNGTFR